MDFLLTSIILLVIFRPRLFSSADCEFLLDPADEEKEEEDVPVMILF